MIPRDTKPSPADTQAILASAARGSAFLTVGRLVARAGAFVFFFLMTRWLPVEAVGAFAATQAIGLILYAFLDYGLGTLLTRDLAASGDAGDSPIRPALRVRALAALSGLAIASIAVATTSARVVDFSLVWLAMLLDASSALLLTGARRDRRLGRIVSVELVRAWSAPLLLGAGFLLGRVSPYMSFFAASALGLGYASIAQWQFLRDEWGKPVREGLAYGKEGLVVAATAVAVGIHNRVDLILLRALDTPEAAGSYAGAYTLLNGAYILPILYSYTLFPDLARLPKDGPALRELLDRGTRMLATLGSLAGAVLAAAPERLLAGLFGATYSRSGTALAVLAGAIPFVFVSNLAWNALLSRRKEMRVLVYIGVAALLNAGMNVWLIPIYSVVGAALATLLAEGLVWVWSWRTLGLAGIPAPAVRVGIATAVVALVPPSVSISLLGAPPVLRATSVLLSWILAVALTRLVGPRELAATLGLRLPKHSQQ